MSQFVGGQNLERPDEEAWLANQEGRLKGLEQSNRPARFQLLAFGTGEDVVEGADAIRMGVTADMNAMSLFEVAAFLKEPSTSGSVRVQVNRVGVGYMLTSEIEIPVFQTYSVIATIDPANFVLEGEEVAVDVLDQGTDAMMLIVALGFA